VVQHHINGGAFLLSVALYLIATVHVVNRESDWDGKPRLNSPLSVDGRRSSASATSAATCTHPEITIKYRSVFDARVLANQ